MKILIVKTMALILPIMVVLSLIMSCTVQHTVPITYIDPDKEQHDTVSDLADRISRAISTDRCIIAVLPFFNLNKNVTNLGRAVAVDLQSALMSRHGSYTVVERDLFGLSVEKELVFIITGDDSLAIDKSTIVKLGHIYGADTLVAGHVYDTGNSFKVVVKVLDVASARILFQTDTLLSRTTQRLRQNGYLYW